MIYELSKPSEADMIYRTGLASYLINHIVWRISKLWYKSGQEPKFLRQQIYDFNIGAANRVQLYIRSRTRE